MNFQNHATLLYNNKIIKSNVVNEELISPFKISKTASFKTYNQNSQIRYNIIITNTLEESTIDAKLIEQDLTWTLSGHQKSLPLYFISASINIVSSTGVENKLFKGDATENGFIFQFIFPAKSTAILSYSAIVSPYADVRAGTSITNVSTFSDVYGKYAPIQTWDTIRADVYSDVRIVKYLYDKNVILNQSMSYVFIALNYGNTGALSTISDVLSPRLTGLSVYNGKEKLTENIHYTYDPNTGLLSISRGIIAIPAAEFTLDPTTDKWITTPSAVEITVTGTAIAI